MKTGSLKRGFALSETLRLCISDIWILPQVSHRALWEEIVVDGDFKEHLLSQAMLNFPVAIKRPVEQVPGSKTILIFGPAGSGKTSLAYGCASKVAETMQIGTPLLVEANLKGLMRPTREKTQKELWEVFYQAVAQLANSRPTIVLLDEVETLVVDSFSKSPRSDSIGMHWVAHTLIAQLDEIERRNPNVLIIATACLPPPFADECRWQGKTVFEIPPLS
jgi:pachytene checkpoint protein 2